MGALAIITVLRNGETIKSQSVEGEVVLGRSDGCVIRLDDRAVSRQHAVFRPTSEGVSVEKKSEFAPLVVNGAECTKAVLRDGDVVSIGPYLLRLAVQKAVAAAAVADSVTAAVEPSLAPPVSGGLNLANDAQPTASIVLDGAEPPVAAVAQESVSEPAPEQEPAPAQEAAPEPIVDDDAKTKLTPAVSLEVKLLFPPGAANVTEYEFNKNEISIGRSKNCDIVLNEKKASRKHVVIRRVGARFAISDLGSANGTFVNGEKISERELVSGDKISIGDVEFELQVLSTEYQNNEKDFMPVPDVEEAAPAEAVVQPDPAPVSDIVAPAAVPDLGNVPGLADVPGLDATKKKVGLYEKYIKNFKTLPPKQKAIVAAVGLALVYFLVFDEPAPEPVAKTPAKPVAAKTEKGPVTFESLSPDQKRFVEAQHALAFDHYRNKDYDKALYEVRKIFNFVPDYKDSKEIERYAMEGKRKLEAIEEEARKKEEEARMKAQIAQLLEETRAKMEKKQYEQATELFIQLLTLDPENEQVAKWKKEIEDYEEQKRLDAQAVAVQEEINQKAWEIFREAQGLKKNGKCHSAIELFRKIPDIGSSDKSVVIKASAGIKSCFAFIRNRREPLLQQAKGAEDAQDYSKAFKLYKQATVVDPPHRAGYAGMSRIRNVLHEKAKLIYTEAILAESYSDFAFAKKKFNEILTFAPEDDIYYERARHKLSFYFRKDEGQ